MPPDIHQHSLSGIQIEQIRPCRTGGAAGANALDPGLEMVPSEGLEPPTFGLQNRCTTTVLTRRSCGIAPNRLGFNLKSWLVLRIGA